MVNDLAEFRNHFNLDSLVTIDIDLGAHKLFEGTARLTALEGSVVEARLTDGSLPPQPLEQARVVMTNVEGWALCRCVGTVEGTAGGETITLRITGPVEVQQRREFFRWDVALPVTTHVCDDQQLSAVRQQWEKMRTMARPPVMVWSGAGYKVVRWRKGRTVKPMKVNLSGSGLRFIMDHELLPGTLVNLEIFLPLTPARVITAVGAVIRSTLLQLHEGSTPAYLTAFNFEFITERDRDSIISFLFIEQRNTLRQKAEERAAAMDDLPEDLDVEQEGSEE